MRSERPATGLASRLLGQVRFCLVTAGTPVKRMRDGWNMLATLPLALVEGSAAAELIAREYAARGLAPDFALLASSYEQVRAGIERLGCAGVLPAFALLPRDAANWRRIDFPELDELDYELTAFWNPDNFRLREWTKPVLEDLLKALAIPKARPKLGR